MATKAQPTGAPYGTAEPAIERALRVSRKTRGVTFWVTLQPQGWEVKAGGRCPDIRSVPLWRVRNGVPLMLMEYPKRAR